jgi:hypothetical protein
MYSFAQREDTTVLDEPYYAVYLVKTDADHPGKQDVINNLPTTEKGVAKLISVTSTKPVLFIKNMAHHLEILDNRWVKDAVNVFLIRNPYQIIASYAEVINKPVMRDIGIEYQYQLFDELANKGKQPVVLDSGLLLENPEEVLKMLCKRCSIEFDQRMLHWPTGPKAYDGVWSTHWYANVHQSSSFEKQRTSTRVLPSHLQELYLQARGFYEKLLPISLKA